MQNGRRPLGEFGVTDEVMGSESARIQHVARAVVLHFVFSSLTPFNLKLSCESRALRSDALVHSRCAGSPLLAIVRLRRAEDGPAYLILQSAASVFGFHVCRPIEIRYRSGWDLDIPLCLLRGTE